MGEALRAGAFQGLCGAKIRVVTNLRCLQMRTRNNSDTKTKRVRKQQKNALGGHGRKKTYQRQLFGKVSSFGTDHAGISEMRWLYG